jgi:hypothetical protein
MRKFKSGSLDALQLYWASAGIWFDNVPIWNLEWSQNIYYGLAISWKTTSPW